MRLAIVNTFCLFFKKGKTTYRRYCNAVGGLVFFVVNLVKRRNGHVFFNSLNKMTNAAHENAMRRGPRN